MRALIVSICLAAGLAGAGAANAASVFYIRGGGDGHGIGMSQYGAYGYALHGQDYRWILGHYYQGTALGQTDPGQVVRVLLATGSTGFSGATNASGPAPGQKAAKLNVGYTYTVRQLASGQLGVFTLAGKKVYTSAAPLSVTGPGPLMLAGHGGYHGALEFRPSGNTVQTVDAVDLEDYVRGVISAEMPSSWAPEALKAQAVAARTYAITSNVSGNGYQLYPDTRSQMYGGVAAETPTTDAAVAATRGQVVTYDGQPVTTFFFASSGGHTEDIENVWLGTSPEPWLRGVADPYDGTGGNPDYRWTQGLSIKATAAKLGKLVKGKLIGIKVTRRGVSPRVVSAEVVGSKGTVAVTGPQLQQIFGLMSTYMFFADISSAPGSSGGGSSPTGGGGPTGSGSGGGATTGGAAPGAAHLSADNPFAAAEAGFEVLPPPPPALVGSIFPAPRGARVAVEKIERGRWRTVGHVRLGAGGDYSMTIRHSGTYRVVWHGLAGPATAMR